MEKRQLDFNAPLMSARRYSSPLKTSEPSKWKAVEKPLPSRQQSLPPNKSDWESEEVTKPASVPFHWEQIPGRPKGEFESHSHTPEEANMPRLPPSRCSSGEIPKLPPGRLSGPSRYCSGERTNDYKSQAEAFSFTDHASLLERLNDSLNCRDDTDSESGEDAYSDALDTLSLTDSWSFNYSVSGISGYQSSGVKPSGTFCIDKQTRDFMMNRFLPAAKAVVLETPEYSVKKPSLLKEKKEVSREMKPPLRQYSSDALPYYTQYINNVESEDEDKESIAPIISKKSGKTWGILPRFCVKNSLCLLNPLPALKSKPKSRPPSPAKPEVRRLTRNAHSGPLDKNACQVVQKKKFYSGLLSRDMPGIDNKLGNESSQFVDSIGSHRSAGVSTSRRSGNISPYRNESPKSPFREGVGFLGVPRESEQFNAKIASSRKLFRALQDVSRNQINAVPTPADPVEKTVYVDYVKKKDVPTKKPSPTKFEEGKGASPKFRSIEKILPRTYSTDAYEDVKKNQRLYQESRNEVPCEAKFAVKEEKVEAADNGREMDPPAKSPLPPPLPKSPSESWLWQTLPSINPFTNSRGSSPIHPKKMGQKQKVSATNSNAKWETIVKTSNLRQDHVRHSEELVHRASFRPMK